MGASESGRVVQNPVSRNKYPTEWHLDEAALDWLDHLLDQQYRRGVNSDDLSAHTRAREMVDLWRAQMGSRRHQQEP